MNIAVIGTGYVGLVSGACFADFGHQVTCVDVNVSRVDSLRRGEVPFFEPGLTEMVKRQSALGRLHFTTSIAEAMTDAAVAFLAVGTPESASGEADLTQVLAVASDLVPYVLGPIVGALLATVIYKFVISGPQFAEGPEPPTSDARPRSVGESAAGFRHHGRVTRDVVVSGQ